MHCYVCYCGFSERRGRWITMWVPVKQSISKAIPTSVAVFCTSFLLPSFLFLFLLDSWQDESTQHEKIIFPHSGILVIPDHDKIWLHSVLKLPQSPGEALTCMVWNLGHLQGVRWGNSEPWECLRRDRARGSSGHWGAQHRKNQEFQAATQVCKADCTGQVQSITVLCLASHS